MEEAVIEAVLPPKDLSLIVKGKRTKRVRPLSSSLNCISDVNNISPPPSSSEEEGRGGGGDGGMANNNVEEDDEELAINCLILLSQGTPNYNKNNHDLQGGEKFTSKKYIEAPISSNGKAGMYVYQCKTCGRTFPSFQALGGHRASHKKPRNIAAAAAAALEANKMAFLSDDEEEEAFRIKNYYKSKKPTALSLELSNWGGGDVSITSDITNKLSPPQAPLPKIHECSYCGAQFASGQALGGHMRRHRGGPTTTVTQRTPSTNTTTLSLSPFPISPASINQEYYCDQDDINIDQMKKRKNALTLDLNLPAPDDHHNAALASKNHENHQQKHKQQQTESAGLVISTGRFIECRY